MDELWDDPKNQMDPIAVARLNRITDETGASIVVTSTWRKAFHFVHQLRDSMIGYGITGNVIDMTPDLILMGNHRGDEIKMWLAMQEQDKIDVFVVLDDESVTSMDEHLIKTSFDDGLQDSHVELAIAKLGALPIESR
jgi:hypothetical protein